MHRFSNIKKVYFNCAVEFNARAIGNSKGSYFTQNNNKIYYETPGGVTNDKMFPQNMRKSDENKDEELEQSIELYLAHKDYSPRFDDQYWDEETPYGIPYTFLITHEISYDDLKRLE